MTQMRLMNAILFITLGFDFIVGGEGEENLNSLTSPPGNEAKHHFTQNWIPFQLAILVTWWSSREGGLNQYIYIYISLAHNIYCFSLSFPCPFSC